MFRSSLAVIVAIYTLLLGVFGCRSAEPTPSPSQSPARRDDATLAKRVLKLGEGDLPTDPHILESMAKLMLKQQNYPKAIDLLRRALLSDPKRCDLLKLRAEAFLNIEDEEAAFDDLRKCLRIDPNDADALFTLGGLLAGRHSDEPVSVKEAIVAWQHLLQCAPDYPQNEMVRKALPRLIQLIDNNK
jgi:tetratricopeptide (TPR) repeat protein